MIRLPGGIVLSCVLISFIYCTVTTSSSHVPEILAVLEEKDIIPEGTAYDPVTDQVFIGCMYKRKIIAIRNDGAYYDFIKEGQDSIWAPIGMEVEAPHHRLWVISGRNDRQHRS